MSITKGVAQWPYVDDSGKCSVLTLAMFSVRHYLMYMFTVLSAITYA